MHFGEEGGRALAESKNLVKTTHPACCEMFLGQRPFEPELVDSVCHYANEFVIRFQSGAT